MTSKYLHNNRYLELATLRRIADFKSTFTNLAQTSHFQVIFGGFSGGLRAHLLRRGVDERFLAETAGLLCYSASLPGSSFSTSDVVGNYMGVAEKFAHTRQFTQIDLEFYVDREYKTLKFLEHWMEYIASGSGVPEYSDGYYFRMQYPSYYKCSQTRILKFDRDYTAEIEYNFFGLFPMAMGGVSVNYGNSDILRASATFNFERYVAGSVSSLSFYQGIDNNKQILRSTFIDPFANIIDPAASRNQRLATGRDELINRNLNLGTGRLDDPRPVGVSGRLSGALSGGLNGGNGINGQSGGNQVAYEGTRRVL